MQGPVVVAGQKVNQLFRKKAAGGIALQVYRWFEQSRGRSNLRKWNRLFQLVTGEIERRLLSALSSAVRNRVIYTPTKTLPLKLTPNKRVVKYL